MKLKLHGQLTYSGQLNAGQPLRQGILAAVELGDVNHDGLPDLFVVNLGIDRAAPPENMMKGRFAEVSLNTSQKKRP